MEIDALSKGLFENDAFRSQNQSFKDDFDERLFYLLANNLPNPAIVANNTFILQRMNILFADIQPLLVKNNVEFVSTHVFGSQASGLALKDSDIDLTILTKTQAKKEKTPQVYNVLQKVPESKFLKLGFRQKFTFTLLYHPVMKQSLLQISNIQTKKYPTHLQSIDFILNGYDGITNSLAVSHLVQTSKAYHYLVLSLKLWLSQFPRKRRMPLYSYYIMAAHYLQRVVHPALLPKVDFRSFQKESFREKLLAQSNISPFQQIDLNDRQNFSGLANLLKGFFNYYGIQYHMNGNKPTIFVNQYPLEKPNDMPRPVENSKQAKSPFNILDPLTGQPIIDLKAFENKISFHVQDMEDAYHRLNSNENIFSQKIITEKNLSSSFKLTKNNSEGEIRNDRSNLFLFKNTSKYNPQTDDLEADDELFRVTQQKQNNSKIDLNVFPEEYDDEFKDIESNKKKRITRRVNDTLEIKLLFQKKNKQQELSESDQPPKPQQPFFKNRNQPKQFKFAESDPSSDQKSFSEVQQHLLQKRNQNVKFAKVHVKNFARILQVLPK